MRCLLDPVIPPSDVKAAFSDTKICRVLKTLFSTCMKIVTY
ncbi:hypothetical protein ATPR_2659 [Acetobacter tropicalis NBRC 101654]|uniref:Uncharacterized protein n=1 Tax=Acetobacter tropicalis NBRC 101654 TaxID=749388 RepID=F7VH10_9PROT|nr:hypothetical protein ATPR_2659 [Acetobacter tropicalis NBRC 101654]